MNSRRYDVIVIGVGGVGSAATAHLATRGVDVLGLERFDVPNSYGASHGRSRPIRPVTDEDEAVQDLSRHAEDYWRDLETNHDRQLLYETGTLDVGRPDGPLIERTRAACEHSDLEYELLSSADITERYPVFDLPREAEGDESEEGGGDPAEDVEGGDDGEREHGEEAFVGLFQPGGGFLVPEQCIVAQVNRAHEEGATIRARERVTSWQPTTDGVRVNTNHDEYRAESLVITSGAWTARFVEELEGVAVPERHLHAWLHPDAPEQFSLERFPVFTLETPEGRYDGYPTFAVPGFKFGRRHHREEVVGPDEIDREPMPEDERILRSFAQQYVPAGAGQTMRLEASLATTTPDGNPVLDTLEEHPQVAVATGFDGHRFATTPFVGEILADLTLEGETEYEIDAFSMDRFSD